MKKLRHGPIFTKFDMRMCFDEPKRKVNYKFFVRGHERSQEVKMLFSLKMLLVLQIKTHNHHTLSVESVTHATYRVLMDKGQTLHKGH